MNGKNLLEGRTGPVTQSVDAIKALLQWRGRAADPLPQFVELGKEESRLVLVLSNKRDVYYCCTARACSCPGNQFRHNCKHMRKYFPQAVAAKVVSDSEPLIKRGGFKPFSLLPGEEKAQAASSLSAIDCHDTRDVDAAYHSIQDDKAMWPMEA